MIWDATRISPELLESDEESDTQPEATKKLATKKGGAVVVMKDTKLDPFNISNDPLYEHSRESKYRIRQTFGAIEVFHAMPAKILQLPYVGSTVLFSLSFTYMYRSSRPLSANPKLEPGTVLPFNSRRAYLLHSLNSSRILQPR